MEGRFSWNTLYLYLLMNSSETLYDKNVSLREDYQLIIHTILKTVCVWQKCKNSDVRKKMWKFSENFRSFGIQTVFKKWEITVCSETFPIILFLCSLMNKDTTFNVACIDNWSQFFSDGSHTSTSEFFWNLTSDARKYVFEAYQWQRKFALHFRKPMFN